MISYLLAVLAAGSNATANVLQRKANRQEPPELSMSPRLFAQLLRRPVWLAGFAAVVASFLLMAAALSMGRLAAVQPIVVIELPLTLLGAARVFGSDLAWREWGAAGAMSAGLAGLVAFLAPHAGNQGHAPGSDWALGSAISVGLIAAVVAGALVGTRPGSGGRRPALLGVATGMTFGLTAAFMKGMTAGFSHGIVGVLSAWQTYAMALCGLGGMFLMQNSLHAGRLLVAQPGITLADPAVAILWGITVFHEQTRGGVFVWLAIASGILMAGSTLVLARSPLLEEARATEEGGQPPPSSGADRRAPAMAPGS